MKCLAAVVLACLLPPLVFETAARFAPERSSAWRPGAAVRVLCIGDSNTFGVGVPDEASYPAQLQTLLDENSPGRFSVINLGTPGMATWQIRQRLPAQLARYSPDIVILLAGVNNGWNLRPPGGEPGLRHRIEVVLLHSRLYRLLRVALRDHSLERTAAATRADGRHQVASQRGCDGQGCLTTWEIEHGGVVDVLSHSSNEKRESGDRQQQAFEDIRAMLRLVAGVGQAHPGPVSASGLAIRVLQSSHGAGSRRARRCDG